MQKIPGALGGVIFIGMGVQGVWGILWICRNFTAVQPFGTEVWHMDMPGACILYLVQLAAAFYAAYRLLHSFGCNRWVKVFGGVFALTFPMAAQCHLALLPNSLTGSFLILELAFSVDVCQGNSCRGFLDSDRDRLAKLLLCWLASACLSPEYLFLGAVPVLFALFAGWKNLWKQDRHKLLRRVLLFAAAAGVLMSVNGVLEERIPERRLKSVPEALAGRFAWGRMEHSVVRWSRELREATWDMSLQEVGYYPANMELIFVKQMKEAVGEERAEKLLLEVADAGFRDNQKGILRNMAWDGAGYVFSPVVLQLQLRGKGYDSYSGRNYEIMRSNSPILTKYYLQYSGWWFAVGIALAVMIRLLTRQINKGKLCAPGMLLFLLTGAVMTGWYTMQGAGIMDYKQTAAIGVCWTLWMFVTGCRGWEAAWKE